MSNDKMREAFEAWECDADQGPQTDPVWLMYDAKTNTYPLDKIQDRWEVWQASRAALVIELPKIINKDWACDSSECEFMRGGINLTKLSILAAGVKVKP
jgi:hypothetical protein